MASAPCAALSDVGRYPNQFNHKRLKPEFVVW
jgi:hypothetical protein